MDNSFFSSLLPTLPFEIAVILASFTHHLSLLPMNYTAVAAAATVASRAMAAADWAGLLEELRAPTLVLDEQLDRAAAACAPTINSSNCSSSGVEFVGRSLSPKSSASSSPPPTQNLRTCQWWSQDLKQHVRTLGYDDPCPNGIASKTVVSGCTGIFAEAEVLTVTQQELRSCPQETKQLLRAGDVLYFQWICLGL